VSEINLPDEWIETSLDSILSDVSYGYTAKSTTDKVGPHLLRITDIQDNQVNWNTVPFCEIEKGKADQYLLKADDLVFARTGATVGKSFLIKGNIPESVFASYLIRVRSVKQIGINYLAHFFNSAAYWNQITEFSSGIGQPNVNGTKLKELNLPLAPLAEQQQIAQKLDELLAQVDTLKTRLDAIPKILKRFRQSVLAAAVSGRLTEAWRANHVKKILDIKKIEDELFFGGITHGNFGKKYDKAAPINIEEKALIIEHVDNFPLVRIGSICQCIVPNRDKPKSFSGSTHWLLTQHFGEDSIWIDYKKIEQGLTDNEILESNAKVIGSGNVIMTCVGRVGLSAVLEERAVINQQLHAFVVNDYVKAEYLAYCIRANTKYFEEIATSTTVSYLNKTSCNSLPIPLPTIEEQIEIVRRVEQLFTYADQIEQRVKDAQVRVNHLTQSILAKAFRGELTADWRAQNPELISGENSAAALLERIRVEREVVGKSKRKSKA
jgi:type I restriction enzyme S subunit